MSKWAFLGVAPHMGGTWTVFETLRFGLAQQGIELRWMVAGQKHVAVLEDPEWGKEVAWGEVVAPMESDEGKVARELATHLDVHYRGAIVNVLCDRLCTNLMRYMPESFPRIMLVHNITIGTYAAARSIRDHVHATVGVSQRIADDLIQKYGFDSVRTGSIPNAVLVQRFMGDRVSLANKYLRILVLSRIENQSKGCFQIPKILQQLAQRSVPYKCTIIGDGPDLEEMKRLCAGLEVYFPGRIPPAEVPEAVSTHDVYLFPSLYEGFGLSLLEAMAGGCVPVSSYLKGVTERIVEDQVSGFLIASSNIGGFAEALEKLFKDPGLRQKMGRAAQMRAQDHFSTEAVSREFFKIMEPLELNVCRIPGEPRSLDSWRYPLGLRSGFRTFLPGPLKKQMRLLREKFV